MNASLANLSANPDPLHELLDEMLCLKQRILSGTDREMTELELTKTTQDNLCSIVNLLNYIVMRREDLRPLQGRLMMAGLSSLGRGEPHVLANVNSVIDILSRAVLNLAYEWKSTSRTTDYNAGHDLLRQRTESFFGKVPVDRSEYIMVTMPTEVASDPVLADRLIDSGMDIARINCAHDNESVWLRMIHNIKQAAKRNNRPCRIQFDLAGHKIRTASVVLNIQGEDTAKPPRVRMNDWLVLCRTDTRPAVFEALFDAPLKAVMTCSYPDIVERLRCNESVWIDDGKIGAVIKEKRGDALLLQVKHVAPKGARVKVEKGLNFPDTSLGLPPLSQKDLEDLPFVSRHADMVGLSFTEQAEDVFNLQQQLASQGAGELPVIAKIETAHAVQNLPNIISRSLARNIRLGIMIARGDLAIELGSVRMAEIQEEILWLCEAAHIPVIWATQVFESLAKKGVAARAEITDAAMAVRAECVMLNKGPYIEQAVSILSEILQRMEAHQFKKISRLRALHW